MLFLSSVGSEMLCSLEKGYQLNYCVISHASFAPYSAHFCLAIIKKYFLLDLGQLYEIGPSQPDIFPLSTAPLPSNFAGKSKTYQNGSYCVNISSSTLTVEQRETKTGFEVF